MREGQTISKKVLTKQNLYRRKRAMFIRVTVHFNSQFSNLMHFLVHNLKRKVIDESRLGKGFLELLQW